MILKPERTCLGYFINSCFNRTFRIIYQLWSQSPVTIMQYVILKYKEVWGVMRVDNRGGSLLCGVFKVTFHWNTRDKQMLNR